MKKLLIPAMIACIVLTGCVTISGDLPSILDKPVLKVFSASPSLINTGELSTLSWTVNGANSVYIDQGVGNVALTGTITVSPVTTTVYTITARNAAGSSTARCQVTVRGTSPSTSQPASKPIINYFKAEPSDINAGGTALLSWDIQGAIDISITPDIGKVEPGTKLLVSPVSTTTYTILASNDAGSESTSLTVFVKTGETQLHGAQVYIPLMVSESCSLTKSGSNYTRSVDVCAGDNSLNLPIRAFLSFDISSIPANAVVQEAVLDLGEYDVTGNPVYSISAWGNMGALEIYQYQFGQVEDLGRLNYDFPASMAGSFKLTDTSWPPLKIDVTLDDKGSNVIESLLSTGQNRCQFRIQFFTSTNWDSTADTVCMEAALLHLKYSVPE